MISNKLKRSLSLVLAVSMMGSSVAMASKIDIAETNEKIEKIQGRIIHINDENLKGSLQTSLDRIKVMLSDLENVNHENKVKAEEVEKLIKALPKVEELKIEDRVRVEEVRKAYGDLNTDQQKLVSEESVELLKALESRIQELEKPVKPELKVLKSEDTFGLTDVSNLNFMVKSLMNESGTAQKLATLEEVNTHFNNSYTTKGGYKLEAEIVDNELVFRTYMTEELFNEIKEKEGADKLAPYRVTVLKGTNKKEDKILKIAYGQDKIELEEVKAEVSAESEEVKALRELINSFVSVENITLSDKTEVERAIGMYNSLTAKDKELVKEELKKLESLEAKIKQLEDKEQAKEKLDKVLSKSKTYEYDPKYEYKYNSMKILENGVNVEYKDIKVENINLVMNDLARYLGAMHRVDNGESVKSIIYKDAKYTWDGDLKGSNWKNENSTLIKEITNDFKVNNDLREISLKLVGDLEVEKEIQIKGKLVIGVTPIEPAVKVLKSEDTFGLTDVSKLNFMVKSLMNEGGTAQKLATLEEVNTHFNNKYTTKGGYKLEAEIVDNELVFRTYMTEELFNEIKEKEGADKTAPYRVTVLKGTNKKEDKILKIAYGQDKIGLEEVKVEVPTESEEVKALRELINNFDSVENITLSNKAQVESARSMYDSLADKDKELVKEELEKLKSLEAKIKQLEKDKIEVDKKQAKEKLDKVLSNSKTYEYDPKYGYKYSGMEILENGVNVEYKDIKIENINLVMNDLARYLGAMYRVDNGESVKSIIYKDAKYTWDGDLKGSNWKNGNSTLVKEITNDFKANNDLREISLKLVGDLEVEKEIQIKGKLIIDVTPIEPAVKVLKVKNIFGIKNADSIRFRVKSITEPGSKEGTTVQKVATLLEVNDHFNDNYNVKNGYKLEVEVTEENITFRTYMSSDLFDEIKGKDGADKALPYKITVLKDSNKENKIGKLVMYMDGRIQFESLNLKIQEKSNKYLSDVKEDEKMIEDYKKLPEELRDKDTDKAIEELENKIADINKSVDDFMKKVDEAILLKDIETGKKLVKEYSDDMRYDAKEVIAKDSEKLEKLLELGKIAK